MPILSSPNIRLIDGKLGLVWAVKPTQLTALILTVFLCGAGFLMAQAAPPSLPLIEAVDTAKFEAAMGKRVVLHGTLQSVTTLKSGHQKLNFQGTAFYGFINNNQFKQHQNWNLESWVNKEIYVTGTVDSFRSAPQLVVEHPGALTATAPTGAPANPVAPATATPAVSPVASAGEPSKAPTPTGIEIKGTTAKITQLSIKKEGGKAARKGILVSEVMEIRWEKRAANSKVRLRFDPPVVKAGARDKVDIDETAEFVAARHSGIWAGKTIPCITRGDKGVMPTTLTNALLIEATIKGWTIPAGVMVAGGIAGNGMVDRGQNELTRFMKTPLPPNTSIIVSEEATSALADFLVDGQAHRLAEGNIFAVKNMGEAATVLQALSDKSWEKPLTMLATWKEPLKARGPSFLRQPEIRTQLVELVKACPSLLNAKLLLAYIDPRQRPATTWSKNGTAHRLFDMHRECNEYFGIPVKDVAGVKKKMRAIEDRLELMRPRCHEHYEKFVESLIEWLRAQRDALGNEPKDSSPRAKKQAEALAATTKKANDEVLGVYGEIGLN